LIGSKSLRFLERVSEFGFGAVEGMIDPFWIVGNLFLHSWEERSVIRFIWVIKLNKIYLS